MRSETPAPETRQPYSSLVTRHSSLRGRFSGLTWRLAATYKPLVLAATALLGVYLLVVARALYLDGIEQQLAGQAQLVATVVAPQWDARGGIDPTVKRLGRDTGNRVTVIAADGTVYGDSEADPATMESHAGRPEVRAALDSGAGHSTRHSATTGSDYLYVAAPIAIDGRTVGVARVARHLGEIDAQLGRLRNVVLGGVAVSGLLAVGLALLLARHIARPINDLRALAGAMAAGRLDLRSRVGTADEIGQLGRAFNGMADELQETI